MSNSMPTVSLCSDPSAGTSQKQSGRCDAACMENQFCTCSFCTGIAASPRRECEGLLKGLKISCSQTKPKKPTKQPNQTPNQRTKTKTAQDQPEEVFHRALTLIRRETKAERGCIAKKTVGSPIQETAKWTAYARSLYRDKRTLRDLPSQGHNVIVFLELYACEVSSDCTQSHSRGTADH